MIELSGTERIPLEFGGTLDPGRTRQLAGADTAPLVVAGRVPVSLLLFHMDGLRPRRAPLPGVGYREALWRLAVAHEGAPAWLAVACDLDHGGVRLLGASLMRYPVRRARIEIEESEELLAVSITGPSGAVMAVRAAVGPDSDPPAPRPVLSRSGGRLYQVPWREEPGPFCRAAACTVELPRLAEETFGPAVRWAARGLVEVSGVISPISARYLDRGLWEAAAASAQAVVVRLSPPGGWRAPCGP